MKTEQPPQLRIISLWQWWATAMALGFKKNETRHWPTAHRGPLGIHASKRRISWEDMPPAVRKSFAHYGITEGNATQANMPQGALVAVVNVLDCIPSEKAIKEIDPLEELCGGYEPGRFAWKTADAIKLDRPIIMAGRQRFWHWAPPDDFELKFVPAVPSENLVLVGGRQSGKTEAMRQAVAQGRWVRK